MTFSNLELDDPAKLEEIERRKLAQKIEKYNRFYLNISYFTSVLFQSINIFS
jgi:hypothetical protein